MTGIWSTGAAQLLGLQHLGFFAPEPRYASNPDSPGDVVREFKQMVKDLHNAGIEVILDVVYNHTAEGNHAGPTLSFRGIDNLAYYRTVPGDPRHYMDFTGCGNTLNMVHPHSCSCSWTACATGSPRCTSTAFASIWPRRWRGN
jgi:isoamylase